MGKNFELLIKSLDVISRFYDDINSINNGTEFIKIHERNIKDLKLINFNRDSNIIIELINEYPKITENEINQFISDENKEVSLISFAAGRLIGGLTKLIKNKGVSSKMIKAKFEKVKSINQKLMKIVEDPIYETLYSK